MNAENVNDAFYHVGGKNAKGKKETPHILTDDGEKTFFLIRCHVCNTGLCKKMTIGKTFEKKNNMIFVEPCPRCLKAAKKRKPVKPLKMNREWQLETGEEE